MEEVTFLVVGEVVTMTTMMTMTIVIVTDAAGEPRKALALGRDRSITAARTTTETATPREITTVAMARRTRTHAAGEPRKALAIRMDPSITAARTPTETATPREITTVAMARRTRTNAHTSKTRKSIAIRMVAIINVGLSIMAAATNTLDTGVARTKRNLTHAKAEKQNTATVRRRLITDIMSNIGTVDPTSITIATRTMASIAAKIFTNKI